MNLKTEVILVDAYDRELGVMEKMEAHEKGVLHRAFSVFIFNTNDELLLQQRTMEKYHSGGLWTNTCCSHPLPGEETIDAAKRRLQEEMGMTCELKEALHFTYNISVGLNLTEHELDHVFVGASDAQPTPNAFEVMDWKYMEMDKLSVELKTNPQNYSAWLKQCFDSVYDYFKLNKR